MSHNLVIDQGNSTAKVDVFEGSRLVEHFRHEHLAPHHLEELGQRYAFDAAIYCSVARYGEEIIVTLRNMVRRVYELTSLLPLPVKIAYTTPSTLGRDRIAAVAGAYAAHPGEGVLVVDAGTAVTYDYLSPDGTFTGGNIAPGLWMRAVALHRMTSRLPLVEVESHGEVEPWGTDTENAIRSGVVLGVAGEIESYRRRLPEGTHVMLTGGDATRLAPLLTFEAEVDTALVTKGLNSILLYNEQL